MVSRRSAAQVLVASLVAFGALGGLAASPAAVSAADGRTDTATSTYALDPAHGVIRVTVDYKVVNSTPNGSESYPCIQYEYTWYGPVPYSSTCTRTIRYYYNSTSIWVEAEATGIKVTSTAGKVTVKAQKPDTYFRRLDVTFPNVFYRQTRTLRLTYTIPSGKPRSANPTRALRAYANFCAISHGYDGGVVRIRIPAAFSADLTGSRMTAEVAGGTRTYSSGSINDPNHWWACLEGVNGAGYDVNQLAGPDNRTLIVESWPEDADWSSAVRSDVLRDLPALVRLTGHPMSGSAPLVIKETVTGAEYAGFYDTETNTITVDEDFAQPALVGHELAHIWFNEQLFRDTWLSEGDAEWAGRAVEPGVLPCSRPTAPGGTRASLASWQYLNPKSTDDERAVVEFQYDAACYVITAIADAAGTDEMTRALVAIQDGEDPYAVDPSATGSTRQWAISWRRWLDAIDEFALYPAHAREGLASDLMVEFGIAPSADSLRARDEARAAFHELQDTVGDWVVPEAVRAPLRDWSFDTARAAIAAADETWTLTGEADEALSGIDARHGPSADAWASAKTVDDLNAAAALARRQLDAADDVAAAQALVDAPRDVVEQIGLLGTTVPDLQPAVAAVRSIDTDTAASLAASVRTVIGGARDAGQLRISVAVAVTGGLLLVVLVLVLRRRRRARALAVAAAGRDVVATSEPTPAAGEPGFIGPVLVWSAPEPPDGSTVPVATLPAPEARFVNLGSPVDPGPPTPSAQSVEPSAVGLPPFEPPGS